MFVRRVRQSSPVLFLLAVSLVPVFAQDAEMTPSKPDVPFLVHAGSLVETMHFEAAEERKKNDLTYYVPGGTSPARTPLAGPEFMVLSDKLDPNSLRLYPFEVRNGRREITFNEKKRKRDPVPIILSVFPVSKGLYKVRVDESLERGEYALTPDGTNDVFCFTVY